MKWRLLKNVALRPKSHQATLHVATLHVATLHVATLHVATCTDGY